MDTASILKALKQERDRINAAIAVLSSGTEGHGLRRSGHKKPGRRLSSAARKRISAAAKARWAKAKKAGRISL